jgi:hypothetical protein
LFAANTASSFQNDSLNPLLVTNAFSGYARAFQPSRHPERFSAFARVRMNTVPRPSEVLVAKFLRDALTADAVGVPKLEAMARAAGLLGQGQRITHAKVFKRTKKSLGVRSVRNGFGNGGEWLWLLEKQPAPPAREPSAQLVAGPVSIEDTYAEALDLEEGPADVRARRIPSSWIDGVARLEHHRPLADIPPHRWRQFLSDCNKFLTGDENWAGRAAELGWNGGRIVEIHRDWAVIELAANGSRRVFERRRVDAGNVTLPWIEWGRRPGDV